MSAPFASLLTIAVIVAIGTAIGLLAGRRRRMDLEQWTVGSRGFGMLLVFLLMAGEVYTTFAFLGVSGWAYSRGGPTPIRTVIPDSGLRGFILHPAADMGFRAQARTADQF